MFWNVQAQEDYEYEMNAPYDSIRERFAGEDLAQDAADEARWELECLEEENVAKGYHASHVNAYYAECWRRDWEGGGNDDIPF